VEIPGFPTLHLPAEQVQIFPAADPSTHTVQLRLPLPSEVHGLKPGLFARLSWRSPGEAGGQRFLVPASAVVRRAELTGLYVLDRDGKPILRQVRLGRTEGERIEILSGVDEGDHVVTNPERAARVR
jgi:multidrug efflux pump subunit AcrA (membrane-fusion protein)